MMNYILNLRTDTRVHNTDLLIQRALSVICDRENGYRLPAADVRAWLAAIADQG